MNGSAELLKTKTLFNEKYHMRKQKTIFALAICNRDQCVKGEVPNEKSGLALRKKKEAKITK